MGSDHLFSSKFKIQGVIDSKTNYWIPVKSLRYFDLMAIEIIRTKALVYQLRQFKLQLY